MTSKKSLIAVSAAAALSSAVLPTITSAQTPGGARTITVREKVLAIAKDDVAPKSGRTVSLGDRLITRQALFDANKKRTGTLYTSCTGVGPAGPIFKARLLCTLSYTFADGQVVAVGVTRISGGAPISIVGGTGAYASARGSVSIGESAKGYDSADVITIAG